MWVVLVILMSMILSNSIIVKSADVDETFYCYSSNYDGNLFYHSTNTNFNTAYQLGNTATTATYKDTTSIGAETEQVWEYKSPGVWHVYFNRSFFYFDTSGLPDDATITNVKFYFSLFCVSLVDVSLIIVRDSSGVHPQIPLQLSDYNRNYYTDSNAGPITVNTNSYHYTWTWNSGAFNLINKAGWTKFAVFILKDWQQDSTTELKAGICTSEDPISTDRPRLEITYSQPQQSITFYTDPTNGGTINFDGTTFSNGQSTSVQNGQYSIVANPSANYIFDHWSSTCGTVTNPNSASTTVTVSTTGYLKAWFTYVPTQYTVTFQTNPTDGGTITFNGNTYNNGQTTTIPAGTYSISANPATNYQFTTWTSTCGTVTNPNSQTTTLTVSSSGNLKAWFTYNPPQYTLTFQTDPTNGGTITFNGNTYSNGQSISVNAGTYSIIANPSSNYQFNQWTTTCGYVANPNAASTTVYVSTTGYLKAWFTYIPYNYPPGPPTDLLCENEVNPQKVTNSNPVFSAVYNDQNSGDIATYLQIQVGTDNNWNTAEMWDFYQPCSVNVGSRCPGIQYNGVQLQPGTTYYWRICFYDGEDWGSWSETASFKTYLFNQIITNPLLDHTFNDALPPGIDFWLDPFPPNEDNWFIVHGYGNKVNLAEKYARSGIFAEYALSLLIPQYFSVNTLIGAQITVPIITQEGAYHGALISLQGHYTGWLKTKLFAAARISTWLYVEEDTLVYLPESQPIHNSELSRDELYFGLITQEAYPSGSFTFESNSAYVQFQEGKSYRIWVEASDGLILDGVSVGGYGIAGEAWADNKVVWEKIKIDWHNPPEIPPTCQNNPEIQSFSSTVNQIPMKQPVEFSACATDLDNNNIYYKWYWDDGTISDWLGPYTQGQQITVAHTYQNPGTYFVRLQTKEDTEYSLRSPLSPRIQINVTPPTGTLHIEFPQGNEQWYGGTSHIIQWSYTGSIGDNVMLLLYKKVGGNTYEFLCNITSQPIPNTQNTFEWIIDPTIPTGQYKIIALSIANASASEEFTILQNNPPQQPSQPVGKTSGHAGTVYTYSTSTIEPDNQDLYYWFDWGDGTNSGWLGPYASGQLCSASHSWSKGSYSLRVKAKDVHDAESIWSDYLPISMPLDVSKKIIPGAQNTFIHDIKGEQLLTTTSHDFFYFLFRNYQG